MLKINIRKLIGNAIVAKVLKEYEKITVVKHLMYQGLKDEIELITRLTYTPKDGGKGWIIQVRSLKK